VIYKPLGNFRRRADLSVDAPVGPPEIMERHTKTE
jgi:hypothetical protein